MSVKYAVPHEKAVSLFPMNQEGLNKAIQLAIASDTLVAVEVDGKREEVVFTSKKFPLDSHGKN